MKPKPRRTPRYYDGTQPTSHHLSDLLHHVLQKVRGSHGTCSDQIFAAWSEVIGERLAAMTSPQSFYDGVLKIRVKNSTLHNLLEQHEKPRLLAALRRRFPRLEIKKIVFKIG